MTFYFYFFIYKIRILLMYPSIEFFLFETFILLSLNSVKLILLSKIFEFPVFLKSLHLHQKNFFGISIFK